MVKIAENTLQSIKHSIDSDEGADYWCHLVRQMTLANSDVNLTPSRKKPSKLSGYQIYDPCLRKLWYQLRWYRPSVKKLTSILRAERAFCNCPMLIAKLLSAGIQVSHYRDSEAVWVEDLYFSSRVDAVVTHVPDIDPEKYTFAKFDSADKLKYSKISKHGVAKGNPRIYSQMQILMGKLDCDTTIYLCTSNDNSDIYCEIVAFDSDLYEALCKKAIVISQADIFAPDKLNRSEAFIECKVCDYKDVCHNNAIVSRNCRTCKFLRITDDMVFNCSKHYKHLTLDEQEIGCDKYKVLKV